MPMQRYCAKHDHRFHADGGCPYCIGNGIAAAGRSDLDRVIASEIASSGLPSDDKARKALPIFTYQMEYFPDAFLAEVAVAVAGNDQHNPGERLHWAREKSVDQMNTAARHQFDYGRGIKKDTDGQWHLAKAIWRLKAQLQLDIEAERAAGDVTK